MGNLRKFAWSTTGDQALSYGRRQVLAQRNSPIRLTSKCYLRLPRRSHGEVLTIPELTRSRDIKLNARVSLHSYRRAISMLTGHLPQNVRRHRGKTVRRSNSAWRHCSLNPATFHSDNGATYWRSCLEQQEKPFIKTKREDWARDKEATVRPVR
jgi:hypothetical protein